MNKDISNKMKERRAAFKSGDLKSLEKLCRRSRYSLEKAIRLAKKDYRTRQYRGTDSLKTITNYKVRPVEIASADRTLPDELNTSYARFDALNPRTAVTNPRGTDNTVLQLSEGEGRRAFKKLNAHKAPGPNVIPPRVIKSCATKLAPVFTDIFNTSLTQQAVPTCFKMTTIVPVPKKTRVSSLND